MIKFLLALIAFVLLGFCAFLLLQARAATKQSSPDLLNGKLPACSDKPNCVSSAVAESDSHYIKPLGGADLTIETVERAIIADGGEIVRKDTTALAATYKSRLFGFIDDVLLVKSASHIDVRSSSRVGYSDMGANRKRVERLRMKLQE